MIKKNKRERERSSKNPFLVALFGWSFCFHLGLASGETTH